ncbi:hypothetical protein [Albibacterium sp.]|uniref:hypothetical protein n=1 Tax=Albibacterium sp. TaxID=2952885 RepID=UPI002B9EBA75|nr:hypothetical protein [Albibacterium sp.]HUH19627.1 hypothetical protein [Albibacterium sp.]
MKLNKLKAIIVGCILSLMPTIFLKAQTSETKATLVEGIFVAGYADNGGYLNLVGPAIKFSNKPWTMLVGLLPSLKFKEDKTESGTKNSLITPTLGFGLTTVYKHFAIQIPLFYNGKTQTNDGKWNVGVGIGYKF